MKPLWMISEIEREIAKRRQEIRDIHKAMWDVPDFQMYILLERRRNQLQREIADLECELEQQAGLR